MANDASSEELGKPAGFPEGIQRAEAADEEYAFVRETVRPRPLRFRTILFRFFLIVFSAVLFGAVAGYVFYELQARRAAAEGPSPVTIGSDEPLTETVTPTASPTPTEAPTPTEEPTPTPAPEEAEEPAAEETLSPEEARALTLEQISEINGALKSVAKEAADALVTLRVTTAGEDGTEISTQASGCVIADNGEAYLILADAGILGKDVEVYCDCPGGETYPVAQQAQDAITQLAVYSLPKEGMSEASRERLQVAKLGNSFPLESGDFLIAAGEPYGRSGAFLYGSLHSTSDLRAVTDGEYNLLLTDMQGLSTSSGVLLNSSAEVVGIIAQRYAPEGTDRITALPISPLKELIEKLSNRTPIPYVGILGAEVPAAREELPNGVYVESVEADSPAMQAGIQPGDIIIAVDETELQTLRAYRNHLMQKAPGEQLRITVERPGAEGYVRFDFDVTCAALG